MIKTETVPKETAALIVFGQPSKGGQHAAWFTAQESEAARKAAALRSLAVLEPVPPDLTDVLPKIARGKFVMGQLSLSKAVPEVYNKLVTYLQTQNRAKQAEAQATDPTVPVKEPEVKSAPLPVPPAEAPAQPSARPGAEAWDHLKAGDVVLAWYGTAVDGWWEARILAVEGDLCSLAWCDGEIGMVRRPRTQLGLLLSKS